MELTDVQRAELAALVKDRYAYPEVARRAQMLLWESEGLAVGKIGSTDVTVGNFDVTLSYRS